MIKFEERERRPSNSCQAIDHNYWNIYDGKTRIGWFGILRLDNRTYTDISILPIYRGKGYFKQAYDLFINKYFKNHEGLYAFVSHDNSPSIRAHEKYGCVKIKMNKYTRIYVVKKARRKT